MSKVKLVINDDYGALLRFIEDLPLSFLRSGEVVYSGRNLIKTFDVDGLKLNVKSFKKPILINQIAYGTCRKSKARRSYEYAFRLKENGFHTPDPIAYLELREYKLLKYSLYISIHEEFDGIMREFYNGQLEGREELLRQFALYTAALHEKKILHIDYSSGNILYKKEGDKYTFYLVDLNRMRFGRTISLDTACYNFRRLWGNDEMISFMVKEYARARNFDEATCLRKTFEYRKRFWETYSKQHPGMKAYGD
ncbi:serine/threonine protein kinase [Dysgonomonas hofstadii]|uniref:Serine/threonine protein kinase n=1 Tax=Dysgonomonas hofstadii TaxID=637886 RepID=A0A840CN45_9BACT|nr:lipopolysaccharide kinase InaA family protein [Dysgonomonas hofstadii]MBB4037507.1 serine/threonine protein kinase [Dysgonomonas hofstadii]